MEREATRTASLLVVSRSRRLLFGKTTPRLSDGQLGRPVAAGDATCVYKSAPNHLRKETGQKSIAGTGCVPYQLGRARLDGEPPHVAAGGADDVLRSAGHNHQPFVQILPVQFHHCTDTNKSEYTALVTPTRIDMHDSPHLAILHGKPRAFSVDIQLEEKWASRAS